MSTVLDRGPHLSDVTGTKFYDSLHKSIDDGTKKTMVSHVIDGIYRLMAPNGIPLAPMIGLSLRDAAAPAGIPLGGACAAQSAASRPPRRSASKSSLSSLGTAGIFLACAKLGCFSSFPSFHLCSSEV